MSAAYQKSQRIELFYSYSHKDEKFREELEKHLSILKKNAIIANWNFRKILAGSEWEAEIKSHLNSANIILLLISPDFMASDYCYDVEVVRAMERHKNGEALVVPVILRPILWESSPFSKLQVLPENTRPIIKWRNRDEAFLEVAKGIVKLINKVELNKTKTVNKKIIIVEDDKKWLDRIVTILKGQRFKIETYRDYSDELLLRLGKNDYSLLIADIILSASRESKNGNILAAFARECNRNIPILLISGNADVYGVREAFFNLKVYDFILKSTWDPTSFLETVKNALNKSK